MAFECLSTHEEKMASDPHSSWWCHLTPLTLLLRSKDTTAPLFFTSSSNAWSLRVCEASSFLQFPSRPHSMCLWGLSAEEDHLFFVFRQIQKTGIQCLDHLRAELHNVWQPPTVWDGFHQSQKTNGRNPVLSCSCGVFLGAASFFHQKRRSSSIYYSQSTLVIWTSEANLVCLTSSGKVSS